MFYFYFFVKNYERNEKTLRERGKLYDGEQVQENF